MERLVSCGAVVIADTSKNVLQIATVLKYKMAALWKKREIWLYCWFSKVLLTLLNKLIIIGLNIKHFGPVEY